MMKNTIRTKSVCFNLANKEIVFDLGENNFSGAVDVAHRLL